MGAKQSQPEFTQVKPRVDKSDLADGGEPPFASGFTSVTSIACGAQGHVYVADSLSNRVCRIRPERSGSPRLVNEVFCSGANAARPDSPDQMWHGIYDCQSLAAGPDGSLFASNHHAISEIDTKTGSSRVIAGAQAAGFVNGGGRDSRFSWPLGLTVDEFGTIFVADRDSHSIRRLVPRGVKLTETLKECTSLPPPLLRIIASYSDNWDVDLFAGVGADWNRGSFKDGRAEEATFNGPTAATVDKRGCVFVLDRSNYCIRKIDTNRRVTTLLDGRDRKQQQNDEILFPLDKPQTVQREAELRGRLSQPLSCCYDAKRDCLYVLDGWVDGGIVLRIALNGGGDKPPTLSALLRRGAGDRFEPVGVLGSYLGAKTGGDFGDRGSKAAAARALAVSADGAWLFIGDVWREKHVVWRIALQ